MLLVTIDYPYKKKKFNTSIKIGNSTEITLCEVFYTLQSIKYVSVLLSIIT